MELRIQAPSGESRIVIGCARDALRRELSGKTVLLLIDGSVERLYGGQLPPEFPRLAIDGGEAAKALATTERVYQACLDHKLHRSAWLVGIGGGTICDLAGYCAATFMRGTRSAFVPTTILAQVDASVGGKNGLNFGGIKNIIGTIRQPDLVVCDPTLLHSLPREEVIGGYAEVIKAGAIADSILFQELEQHSGLLLKLDEGRYTSALDRALRVKAGIVERDEREAGERIKLNFGHTLGHAVEVAGIMPHGHAVAIGMAFEAWLSTKRAGLSEPDRDRLLQCLTAFGLPTTTAIPLERLTATLQHDKKQASGTIKLALLKALGSSELIEMTMPAYFGCIEEWQRNRGN